MLNEQGVAEIQRILEPRVGKMRVDPMRWGLQGTYSAEWKYCITRSVTTRIGPQGSKNCITGTRAFYGKWTVGGYRGAHGEFNEAPPMHTSQIVPEVATLGSSHSQDRAAGYILLEQGFEAVPVENWELLIRNKQ